MIRRTLLVVLVLFGALRLASGSDKPAQPSSADLAAITERGRLLAAVDFAAWHASDAVEATGPIEGLVKRYIAHKTDSGWVVAFGRLNDAKDKFLVAYEATQGATADKFSVRAYNPPREDTGFNLTAAKAIDTALQDFRGANVRYNVAALPAQDESVYIYVYPAQVKDDVYPLGADARYRIAVDDTTILEKRQLHKSIIEFSGANSPGKTQAGGHTHVLSEVPEDTDVFLVLSRNPKVPEYIGAGKYIYVINVDGSIALLKK